MSDSTARPHWLRRALLAALLLVAAGAGALYYVTTLHAVTTDDATVDADVVTIVPKVAGYVAALHVEDNAVVTQGQPLLEIDPRDYTLAVDAARTALQSAESRAAEARAQVQAAAADVAQDQADVTAAEASSALANDILGRRLRLTDLSISAENKDTARTNEATARASLAAARLKVVASQALQALAEVQVRTAEAGIAQAKVALDQALLNLSYTKLAAPIAGTVANRNVVIGNFAQPGQLLLSIVPHTVYVVANFKETQLARVHPGAHAHIRIDALRGVTLNAHVDSIQRGSGSLFALLPPENATGNFVKIVQRLPVKLLFDEPPARIREVSPGMSAVVRVDTDAR
jgi:membrane fusion protein (multidrug efflux system)